MLECPEELKSLTASNISISYLYSYWLTFHIAVYAIIHILFPDVLPFWLNPYPTIIGTIVQVGLFILGSNTMPLYFIIGVGLWKLVVLLGAIILLPIDWSLPTITFNIGVLTIYILYLKYYIGINPIDLYGCIINNRNYFLKSAKEFVKVRFGGSNTFKI